MNKKIRGRIEKEMMGLLEFFVKAWPRYKQYQVIIVDSDSDSDSDSFSGFFSGFF